MIRPEEVKWAERDCNAFRETVNARVPFRWEDLPWVNSPPPMPLLDGQTLEWKYRNSCSGQVDTTLFFLSFRHPNFGLSWQLVRTHVSRMSQYFPCG